MKHWPILITIVILIAAFGLFYDRVKAPTTTGQIQTETGDRDRETGNSSLTSDYQQITTSDIAGAASQYDFSAEIPTAWQAEAVPAIEAINLYDPAATGDSNLQKSQIFIRHFKADRFLTLQTVTIHERTELTVGGRSAVRYEIEKKANVADFSNQPAWRSTRHIVTDVRVSDASPSTFYVIAQRPDLDQAIYDHFLETLDLGISSEVSRASSRDSSEVEERSSIVQPVDGFLDRITKKPFGIHITPSNSPVQPERFSGYHTGADAEFGDLPAGEAGVSDEVDVRAIADGTVEIARTADGYGGVVVLEHIIDSTTYHAVYGHLDPADLPSVGATVKQSDHLGRLGDGGTNETDGERKHLHLAFYKGSEPNLKGYIGSESELAEWLDPITLYRQP